MPKFHLTPSNQTRECTAQPGNCRYGENGVDPEHYPTKEAAQKAIEKKLEKEHSTFRNALKKKKMPEIINADTDFSALEPSERADYAIFQGFKHDYSACLGKVDKNSYYGYVNNSVDDELVKELDAIGAADLVKKTGWGHQNPNIQTLEEKGFTVDFVKNSFKDETTSHFMGTFTETNDVKHHVSADVVITNPDGDKIVAPITAQATFSELLSNALDLDDDKIDAKTENLILKAAMKKALESERDNKRYYY